MTENKNEEKRTEPAGARFSFLIYANNEPKSALARDLGDCRDNKGKLAKRVFTCLRELVLPGYIFKRNFEFTIYIDYTN